MSRPRTLLAAILLLLPGSIIAGQSQPPVSVQEPSPRTATLVSVGAFVAPFAFGAMTHNQSPSVNAVVGVTGLYLAPMAGYLYAGMPAKGLRPLGKLLLIDVATVGSVVAICSDNCGPLGGNGSAAAAGLVLAAGAITHLVVTIREIGNVAPTVRAENLKRRAVSFAPTLDPHQRTAGVALSLRF